MKQIPTRRDIEAREYEAWMARVECRAIIPLKWGILGISLFTCLWSTGFQWLDQRLFLLFILYALFTIADSYFFYLKRVTQKQIRLFCSVSFVTDILFVSMLIFLDSLTNKSETLQSNFYVFYFVLILRGFALFRTALALFLVNLLISVLFFMSIFFTDPSYVSLQRGMTTKIVLFWVVILFSWYMIQVIHGQRSELLKIRGRLVRSENLATIGNLASSIAHEINNPIGIIRANVEFLLKHTKDTSQFHEEFQAIVNETERCDSIIRRLLHFATNKTLEIEKVDLRKINEQALSAVFYERDETWGIDREYGDVPLVEVDETQVTYALMNVYLHMKQASPKKCVLTVGIKESEDSAGDIVLKIESRHGTLDESILSDVYEPVKSADDFGAALGIYIARRILETNGADTIISAGEEEGYWIDVVFRG